MDPEKVQVTGNKYAEALDEKDFLPEGVNGIARMMGEATVPQPPEDLGQRIMDRIRNHRPSVWSVFGEALLKRREVSFHPLRALRAPVSGQECSFYFIMIGVFYAVLGAILMVGLHSLGARVAAPGWVCWQPQMALVTACFMTAIGLYLLKDGKSALRTARIGVLVYLGVALLNGIVVPLGKDIPMADFLSLLSMLIGLPTGLFLIRTLQNCGERYA